MRAFLTNLTRSVVAVLVTVAAFIGINVYAIGTAQAAPEPAVATAMPASCPSEWICVYDSANFGGQKFTISGGLSRYCFNLGPSGWNDRVSSVANHTGRALDLWENGCGSGWHIVVNPQSTLSYVGFANDNELSSIWIR